ncbi:MAG: hypothetical protein A3C50_00150 [Candidatus Staskawiczbacteria bacterium RIFCSPHIGHO2_02_FULL_43_16]|uniref:NrS-1 polymerase-like HBD domain-containing protein n=1 Tax=Candidatus Staskawiczbacteria bacterium RIFCSPHIGHO2_01_FULL_41_41 TaxID=1802203 RepID=A0A1G2HW70_9BACT|nr:MAG: hypothetical protein A2822_01815 [Candidatus Staskawiczbacteria bacterium RIFCSPHIGHO2_01_FULL_41_41]OGZ68905.1 MAG: hypothetical protein A3C50_00150 [Candidatus Staskawiczbacteria bacterium RIFCSPHIGHO2_02_FULL_43_16]OGZ74913.1 MAG: hypothetical protein A3A12_03665 [Candidatus Staskawiczbacteria bacterium RIFCSPLOWO2_01_FULL_43_17b]
MYINYSTILCEEIELSEWVNIKIINPFLGFKETYGLSEPSDEYWVNWRLEMRNAKKTKVPYMPNGKLASTTDPVTWSTFDEVIAAQSRFSGIGIVFTGLLLGIDVDKCLEGRDITHEQRKKIAELITRANTYTEVSPSGTGLHLFLKLTAPLNLKANRHGNFEAYTLGRYFTVTQNFYQDIKSVRLVTPEEAESLLSIIGYPWEKGEQPKNTLHSPTSKEIELSDDVVLQKMFASKNGSAIKLLYNGDTSEFDGDESVADASLCSHLAFWVGKDASRIESLWLASPLGNREKTQQRKDYRDHTVEFAIQHCTGVYDNSVSMEKIEGMLEQIPVDMSKLKLMEVLSPIFQALIHIERTTAELFILNNIKEHFSITKADAQKYIPHLNNLRLKSLAADKEEREKEEKLPLLARDIDYGEVFDAISEIGIIHESTLKIITAVIISSQLRCNPPLWLFLIGVPSSLKTELVGLFSATDEVYTLDTLTENAFASGFVPKDGKEPQDLLPLIDNKAFIIKDLNTLFSLNEETVKKILGDLTSIFDGKFEKFTATRGLISYSSLFSMIGCITPSILIKHYNYATQLGPRFLFLRLPELDSDEMNQSLENFWNEKNRKEKIIKTRQIVSSYCTQLIKKIKQYEPADETKEIQDKISDISLLICRARGIAITQKSSFTDEKTGKKVEYYEINNFQVEQPWRIINQLKSLLQILSFINGNAGVGEDEINVIRPVILSTMPVDRSEVMGILVKTCGRSATEIGKQVGKSGKTARRTLKELEALGLVDWYQDPSNTSGKAAKLYFVSDKFASILQAPMPSPECLSLSKIVADVNTAIFDEAEYEIEDTNPQLPVNG